METRVLVYQAYGSQDFIQQAKFSILSLLHSLESQDELQIFLYTDQKQNFSQFFGDHPRIRYFEMTKEQIKTWKGKSDYVHRLKIEALQDAARRFKGCLFYCDGDTRFVSSPMKIFSKVNDRYSLMHVAENDLEKGTDPVSKKLLKFVKTHHFQIKNEFVGIGAATVMWNSAVLGLSEKNKSLLPFVLELTDQSYPLLKKHMMEQLAFSFFIQTKSEILAADSVVHHYSSQRAQYQAAINQFLSENDHVEKALGKVATFEIPAPVESAKKKSILRKILRKPSV